MPAVDPPDVVVRRPVLEDRRTVRYELEPSPSIRSYFTNRPMLLGHDVDVAGVPEAMLVIPFLATVAPIAWALGARVRVPEIDSVFLSSLERVREGFRTVHPSVAWTGSIEPESVVDCRGTYVPAGRALLYSGGIDSLTSFVRHRHERPRLVSIWGADVGLEQPLRWSRAAASMQAFARRHVLDVSFLRANFRTFFNHYRLRNRFLTRFSNWYSGAQQGLGLIGLTAALSHVRGIGWIGIASGISHEVNLPWGSRPEIDNHVRWASTEAAYDGVDLDRQQKIGVLAEYLRTQGADLPIRVCWGRDTNCSACGKCCLTMAGLALEGIDPARHGFRFDAAILARIRAAFTRGTMELTDGTTLRWMAIQRRIPGRTRLEVEGVDEFFDWLQGVSIPEVRTRYDRHPLTAVRRYLDRRPEPMGRWIRKVLGHPFP